MSVTRLSLTLWLGLRLWIAFRLSLGFLLNRVAYNNRGWKFLLLGRFRFRFTIVVYVLRILRNTCMAQYSSILTSQIGLLAK